MWPVWFTSGTRNARPGEESAPAPSSHPNKLNAKHSTTGEPSFTTSKEADLSPSLLFPSALGKPCSWNPKTFCLHTARCPQITLKSPAYSITETLGTSRDHCPNSAQRQDQVYLDHCWQGFILPIPKTVPKGIACSPLSQPLPICF